MSTKNPEIVVPETLLPDLKDALEYFGYANTDTPIGFVQECYIRYINAKYPGFNANVPYALEYLPPQMRDLFIDPNEGGSTEPTEPEPAAPNPAFIIIGELGGAFNLTFGNYSYVSDGTMDIKDVLKLPEVAALLNTEILAAWSGRCKITNISGSTQTLTLSPFVPWGEPDPNRKLTFSSDDNPGLTYTSNLSGLSVSLTSGIA